MTKLEKAEEKLWAARARLEVVEDILSMETDPAYRRNYTAQKSRLRARIADAERTINHLNKGA